MPSLSDSKAKVRWAKRHLDILNSQIAAFSDSKPYRLVVKNNFDERRKYVRCYFKPIPGQIGLILGDFVASLASALDQLAWQLALLRHPAPDKFTNFPIVDHPKRSLPKIARENILEAALPIIESLQPYKSGTAFKDHPLWQLRELWNTDKHRLIPMRGVWVLKNTRSGTGWTRGQTFQDRVEFNYPFPASEADIDLDPQPAVEIQFGETGSDLAVSADRLGEIYNFVRSDVLPKFAGFFT